MYRILSIDGGGLRGIIPIKVLQHIEELTGVSAFNAFDMFAGTSTGGLIALGLTVTDPSKGPLPLYGTSELEDIYLKRAAEIFPTGNKLSQWWRRQVFSNLFRPQFKADGLQRVLDDLFVNDARILHCGKPILVPSYDIAANAPLFFKRRYADLDPRMNARLIDVCRATSAAPTYLPSYPFQHQTDSEYEAESSVTAVDGGVFMNNPALSAVIEVVRHRDYYVKEEDFREEEIFVLSLGTGVHHRNVSVGSHRFGKTQWIRPLIEVMMAGGNQAVDYTLKDSLRFAQSGKMNYLRINVNIEDERYSDMALSSKDALDYYLKRVKLDFMESSSVQDDLVRFLHDSGIM